MGRTRTIDRDAVLDVAEAIVREQGAAALTIDAVAKAAGITKGGVQYCFGTKNELIDAMVDRWGRDYDTQVEALVGKPLDPVTRLHGYLETTARMDASALARAAGMLTALTQSPDHLKLTREWYRRLLAGLDLKTREGRRARLAFLATDGAFMLRTFGLLEISDSEWANIFDDIRALIPKRSVVKTKPKPKGK